MPDSDWSMMVQPLPGLAVAGFDDEVSVLGTGQTHAPSPFGRLGGIRGAEQSLSSVERYLVQQHTNWNIDMLQACLSESRHNIFLSKDIWCIYVGTCYIRCICTVLYLRQYMIIYTFLSIVTSPFLVAQYVEKSFSFYDLGPYCPDRVRTSPSWMVLIGAIMMGGALLPSMESC